MQEEFEDAKAVIGAAYRRRTYKKSLNMEKE
jgi:hypothetical protein